MKRNLFLRAALLLLIGVWASSTLLTGTTWAKYVAMGEGEAKARFAAFSFKVGSGRDGWQEIVTEDGITSVSQEFTMDLFDSEWDSSLYGPDNGGPGGTTITIQSKDGAQVVAPGIGHAFGTTTNNPSLKYTVSYGHTLSFENNSEATVKFKLENITTSADIQNTPVCFDAHGTRQKIDMPYTFPGDNAGTDWCVLQPNQTATRSFWWAWMFDTYGPWGQLGGVPHSDHTAETNLGKQAAAALNGTGTAPTFQIRFRLTVEQVD